MLNIISLQSRNTSNLSYSKVISTYFIGNKIKLNQNEID